MQTPVTRALPRGTRIDAFEIVEVIAEGAVGIVYRADPIAGGETVALMEYMPARLAQRDASGALACGPSPDVCSRACSHYGCPCVATKTAVI